MPATILEALVAKLQASGIAEVTWGVDASPYYEETPEPPPAFPFVVLEIPDSEVGHTFEEPYVEVYKPAVHVVGLEKHVATLMSPYVATSVFRFLDDLRGVPEQLNGTGYECEEFTRRSWVLKRHPSSRAPDGGRVWVASANYYVQVTAPQ